MSGPAGVRSVEELARLERERAQRKAERKNRGKLRKIERREAQGKDTSKLQSKLKTADDFYKDPYGFDKTSQGKIRRSQNVATNAALAQQRAGQGVQDLGVSNPDVIASRGRTFGTLGAIAQDAAANAMGASQRLQDARGFAQDTYNRGLENYGSTVGLGNRLESIAFGRSPTVSQAMFDRNAAALGRQLTGAALGARGGMGGLALRGAQQSSQMLGAELAEQAGIAGLQERNQALGQALGAFGQAADINTQAGLARANLMDMGQRQFFDAQQGSANAEGAQQAFSDTLLDRALEMDMIARGELDAANQRAMQRRQLIMQGVGAGLGSAGAVGASFAGRQ